MMATQIGDMPVKLSYIGEMSIALLQKKKNNATIATYIVESSLQLLEIIEEINDRGIWCGSVILMLDDHLSLSKLSAIGAAIDHKRDRVQT